MKVVDSTNGRQRPIQAVIAGRGADHQALRGRLSALLDRASRLAPDDEPSEGAAAFVAEIGDVWRELCAMDARRVARIARDRADRIARQREHDRRRIEPRTVTVRHDGATWVGTIVYETVTAGAATIVGVELHDGQGTVIEVHPGELGVGDGYE